MQNNGPVYNITTGKFEYPLDDYTAIDTQGHISMRVDAYTSISPYSVKNNQVNSFDYEIHPKKPAGSSGYDDAEEEMLLFKAFTCFCCGITVQYSFSKIV